MTTESSLVQTVQYSLVSYEFLWIRTT